MQSNIKERGLAETKPAITERIAVFLNNHENSGIIGLFRKLCETVLAVTDSRRFMIVMHAISFCVVAACVVAAVKTGKYAYYSASVAVICGLSCLWPKFTTRAMDKWRQAKDKEENRD